MDDESTGSGGAVPAPEIKTDLITRLDKLPWCRFHTTVTAALAVGWTLAAFQTTIIGSVLGQVSKMWKLTATQGSSLVSAWVVGMFIGAMVFGYYSDRKGRKKAFIFSLLWYSFFSLAAAFSWNFPSLLAFRFLTALAIGGEYTAVMATMVEFIPTKHRGKTSALILSSYPIGGMLSSLTSLYCLNHLPLEWGWRIGFGLGGCLAVLGLWVRVAIPESPRWLLAHGFAGKAEEIVLKAERSVADSRGPDAFPSGRPIVAPSVLSNKPMAVRADRDGLFRHLRELFSAYLGRVGTACSLNFAQASVNYGMIALLGAVLLPAVGVASERAPFYYMMGSVGQLVGSLTAAFLLDSWGRKGTVLLGYSLVTLGILNFCFALTPAAVLFAYTIVMGSVIWSSNSAYVVTSEILPVRNRAMGLGLAVAAGRIGAFTSPILLSSIYTATHKPIFALIGLALMSLPGPVAAIFWCIKGTEAKNRSLEEIAGETAK